MSIIGTIAVNVVSRHTQFVRGMDESRRSVGRLATGVVAADRLLGRFGRTVAVIGTGLTAGRIVSQIRKSADELGNLADTSDKLGVATERLAGLRLGGQLSGVEARAVDNSLQRMVRNISEVAKTGKGEAAPALAELGLEARKLSQMTPDQMLSRIADQMIKVENQGDRVRLAFKLFGREGTDMVVMLKDGAAGLEDFQRQAERLGIALKRDDIRKVEELGDNLDRLQKAWGGLKDRLVIDVAPVAITAIKALEEAVRGARLINRDIRAGAAAGGGAGVPGFFSRLMSGDTAIQKRITDFIVRGDLAKGVARGTAAPTLDELGGVRGIASMMARQPGFDPRLVDASRGRAIQAENARARGAAVPLLFGRARDAGERAFMTGATRLRSSLETFANAIDKAEDFGSRWQRQELIAAFSGRGLRARDAVAEMRRERAEDERREQQRLARVQGRSDDQVGFNEALERGTAAAFAASRQSDRVNRLMQEQLAAQKQSVDVLNQLLTVTKQATQDVFGAN